MAAVPVRGKWQIGVSGQSDSRVFFLIFNIFLMISPIEFGKIFVPCWVPKERVSWHNFPKINERVDTLFWHSRVGAFKSELGSLDSANIGI